MADHVEDDAAAILHPIIPRRPLRLLPVALEHPVSELSAHGGDPPEESGIAQERQLLQSRQEQLVLHGAVLDALGGCELEHRDGFIEVGRDRFLAVDVLAGADRLHQQRGPCLRGRGVKEDGVVLGTERLLQLRCPARYLVLFGQALDLLGVAADQYRVGHHAVAIGEQHAALIADRDDGADQMLV